MKISSYNGGFLQTNGYLLETPDGNLLIDAPVGIDGWLAERGVRVDHLLLTHQHFDHVEAAHAVRAMGACLHAYAPYSKDLTLESSAREWGLPISVAPYEVDELFNLKKPLQLAGLEMSLAHVPGHSTDSVTFHLPGKGIVFSGDTLFSGGLGRADLPGGSLSQLIDGIAKHLLVLPGSTRVYPGHGPATTIDAEIRENACL